MYEVSKEHTPLISGGYWVYVTPQWKHEEAVISGVALGTIGAAFGSIAFFAEMSCVTLAIPFALGAAGYGIGYAVDRLGNCLLEDYTWYNIQPTPVILYY